MSFFQRKSAPRRPPTPPDSLLAGVGGGDYWYAGERALFLLNELAGLRSSDRILDVGCGLGRVAWPLEGKLGRSGSYDGLDVVEAYTDWCVQSLGLDPARFRFHHADIRTSSYNPNGSIEAKDFVFPWAEESFTLTIATSLFTHLLPDATTHYFREIARTLRRGGRLFGSLFLLDAASREAAAAGITDPTLGFPMEHGLLHDPAVPESAVAYDAEWIFEALAAAGLSLKAVHSGNWKGQPGLEHQDLLVAVRK